MVLGARICGSLSEQFVTLEVKLEILKLIEKLVSK